MDDPERHEFRGQGENRGISRDNGPQNAPMRRLELEQVPLNDQEFDSAQFDTLDAGCSDTDA